MKGTLKVLVIALALFLVSAIDIDDEKIKKHLEEQEKKLDMPLDHLSYDQIVQTFYDLQKEFPDYIKVYDAALSFDKGAALPQTRCFQGQEEIRSCKYIYAQMTNFSDPNHKNFTQSFYSGNFHGDEVVGPNIVTYLAKYILEKPLLKILSRNFLVLLPLGNPSGYYNKKREEQQYDQQNIQKSFDMNRDFPYDVSSKECFLTAGARIINYIWQKHLFTASITFHGGMTAIGWPWGSTNHVDHVDDKGHFSPDQNAFYAIGKRMSDIAGFDQSQVPVYPYDTLTNAIYAVKGSFEDWSYAASWEKQFDQNAPLPKCDGISETEMEMNDNIARSMTYLIETTDQKMPNHDTYGRWIQINNPSKGIGHVSRNVRLVLDFINNLTPSYDITIKLRKNFKLFIKWEVQGCENVEYTHLFIREKNSSSSNITNNNYKSYEELVNDGFVEKQIYKTYSGSIKSQNSEKLFTLEYEEQLERTVDVALFSSCDSKWSENYNNSKPTQEAQSHFVRSRQNETYAVENNGYFINSNKYIISAFGPYLLQEEITQEEGEDSSDANDYEYLYILFGILFVGGIASYFFYKKFNSLGQNRINFEELNDDEMQVRSSPKQSQDTSARQNTK